MRISNSKEESFDNGVVKRFCQLINVVKNKFPTHASSYFQDQDALNLILEWIKKVLPSILRPT